MLTIFFIWLGSVVPARYQAHYEECLREYGPCKLLGEKEEAFLMETYNMTDTRRSVIERADVMRLLTVYHYGGIYLDLDTKVNDWDYLKLFSCEGETFFAQEQYPYDVRRFFEVSNWHACSGKGSP